MQHSKRFFLIFSTLLLTVTGAFAGEGKLKGYMFGDYYYVAKNHDSELEDKNGFWFRRIYFTYDNKLSDEWSVRFRLEMNSAGDFTSKTKLEPFAKDAYVQWKRSGHAVLLGLSGTPTWGYVEKFWGYRSVEKTTADLFKIGSSRDFGVAAKGKFGRENRAFYHAQVGNGSSTGTETNSGKKLALAAGYHLTDNLSFEAYGDFEERPGETNRHTLQGFLGYKTKMFRVGGQVLQQTRDSATGDDDIRIASFFGAARLGDQLQGFARVDRAFDPMSDGPKISFLPVDGTTKFTFLLFGLDYTPHKQVHLMPNVEVVTYDTPAGAASSPGTDVIPRFTFYYVWK